MNVSESLVAVINESLFILESHALPWQSYRLCVQNTSSSESDLDCQSYLSLDIPASTNFVLRAGLHASHNSFFDRRVEELLKLGSSLSESDWLAGASIISPQSSMAAMGYFYDSFTTTIFWSATGESVFRHTNVVIGAINVLDVISLFESFPSAA